MACNLYLTDVPERKLKQIFSNAKNFYMLDIQGLIETMRLDPTKNTSIYIINEEIQRIILQQSVLKRNLGIFYIVNNITEPLFHTLERKRKAWPEVKGITLIDNGQFPKHSDVMHLFGEVIFYEKFKKNKIIVCSSIAADEDENSLLTKALSDINNVVENEPEQ